MKILIKTKPNVKIAKVEKINAHHFLVWVKEPAKNNKANEAVCRALADYFGVSASLVRIISGRISRQKIVEVFLK